MSLERFVVALDDPTRTYSPGEVVTGRIFVDVSRRKTVRGLKVRIKGKAEVRWTESTGTGSDRKSTVFTGDEEYFRMEFYVLGHSGGDNVEIEEGSHVYPFNFCLPRNIPSSFETTHGSVRYSVKAIIDRPWKFDHERTVSFNVETPLDLTQSAAELTVINEEEYDTFCCFSCFNVGALRVNIFLPSSAFAIGEAIRATIHLSNTSTSVDVEKIKLKLEQKIRLYSRFPHSKSKSQTDIVQNVKENGPFNKTDEVVVSMQVPSLPYSDMIHCSLIDIGYRLKVIVVTSGCHMDIEKEFPITIGTRSAMPAMAVAAAPVPTAPFVSDVPPVSVGAMPMPMPTEAMPMPMPSAMPAPYLPDHGEKITPAPGFQSTITNHGYAPTKTPYPTGNSPYPTDNTPHPTNNTPYPTDNSPRPTSTSPYPTGNSPYPTGNSAHPTGNSPYPTGNSPYPTGNSPYPPGNTPYPTGNTPYPMGNTPYPPPTPGPLGFVAPSPAQPSFSTDPTAPPSYTEAMSFTKKH